MDASEVNTIEDILRQYDIDGLIDPTQFSDLLDELRQRESIMVEDALGNTYAPKVGDEVKLAVDLATHDLTKGLHGRILQIMDNDVYKYLVRFGHGYTMNLAIYEFDKVK